MNRDLNLNRILTAILILLVSAIACGQDNYSPRFNSCMDKSGGVTVAMIDCIAAETKAQDVRLNENYKALQATLTPTRKTELLEAQRAWIKFRDLNCKFYFNPDGGTMATVMGNDCFLKTTADRASELKALGQ